MSTNKTRQASEVLSKQPNPQQNLETLPELNRQILALLHAPDSSINRLLRQSGPILAQDLRQDMCVKFLRWTPEAGQHIHCLEAYVYTTLRNEQIKRAKKAKRDSRVLIHDSAALEKIPAATDTEDDAPDIRLAKHREQAQLTLAQMRTNKKHWKYVEHLQLEMAGLTRREIAQRLGKTESTAARQSHRARECFRTTRARLGLKVDEK